ncbi:hypothetical protein ACQCT3_02485 [Sutcliffiella horikoshii]|uniref:hypothetical protein n=1 Tax=Sutcliffiella horikoshii TaxID=79883 RepID=UPI003CE89229
MKELLQNESIIIAGTTVTVLVLWGLMKINKVLKDHLDVNVFRNMVNFFFNRDSSKKYEKLREDFYKGSTTPEFVDWQKEVLKEIYSEYPLLNLFGKEYPTLTQEARESFSYPIHKAFKGFSKLNNIKIPEFIIDQKQSEYIKMMGSTVKRPNMIGFFLDEFELDAEGKIAGF